MCCGLFDLVMRGGCVWDLCAPGLSFRPLYVYRLVRGVSRLVVITCGVTRVGFVGCRGTVVTYDCLSISQIPFLFDVLGVELLKLVRSYLVLSILYGFFTGVRIVKSEFLRLWYLDPRDSFYDPRVLLGHDSILWGITLVGLLPVY